MSVGIWKICFRAVLLREACETSAAAYPGGRKECPTDLKAALELGGCLSGCTLHYC